MRRTPLRQATGILRIPRFGADYEVPILEGSSDEVLAAGVGHLEDTAAVGERGNYALAAHRITHGEPFADFPELREGDLVHIETVDADYTYVLDTGGPDLTVPFTASWVLDPFPVNPDPGGTTAPGRPGARLITLVTCSELFHTDNAAWRSATSWSGSRSFPEPSGARLTRDPRPCASLYGVLEEARVKHLQPCWRSP